MVQMRVCDDMDECQRLWIRLYPKTGLFDQWEVRSAFHRAFERPPHFVVAEEASGEPRGLLALSWIEEVSAFGAFPGETWNGKTWLEQNRVITAGREMLRQLVDHVPAPLHMRYCVEDSVREDILDVVVDEMGYLFFPAQYDFDFSKYLDEFSGKTRRNMARELSRLEAQGVSFRFDCLADIEYLFRMNCEAFGETSYFSDARFLSAFEDLVGWICAGKHQRVTTILIGGKIAAVDLGVLWQGTYTLLAGATNPAFPGIAKMINLHHLEWACRQRLSVVDFLCGDFGWKERFHLNRRPLYAMGNLAPAVGYQAECDRVAVYG